MPQIVRVFQIVGGDVYLMNYIESKPGVMMGKPVIAGTRITVENILERLGAGETVENIVTEHPRLTREAVLAAVEFGDLEAR